jgi:hypothetical protein
MPGWNPFGKLSFSKSKAKYSDKTDSTENRVIDPRVQQFGYDTMDLWNNLTSGVFGRYLPRPSGNAGASSGSSGMSGGMAFLPGISRDASGGYYANPPGGDVNFNDPSLDKYKSATPGSVDFNDPNLDPQMERAATGPSSFIPDFSDDTTKALGLLRNFTGSGAQLRALAAGIDPANIGQIGKIGPVGSVDAIADPGSVASIIAEQQGEIERAQGATARQFLDQYVNDPTMQSYIDASLADFDVGADRQANARRARRDAGAAFGSRAGTSDAVFDADVARGRGALGAGIRFDAYGRALNAATGDAGRATQAALQNASQANIRAATNAQLRQGANITNADIAGRNIDNTLRRGIVNADIQGGNLDRGLRLSGMNADIEGRNIDNKLRAAGINIDALRFADSADLGKIEALLTGGQLQDELNLGRAQEPLELLKQRLAILTGMPYGYTTKKSSTSSGRRSGSTFGGEISSG